MRSGLVLYRLVFIKNAPVCAGAFFLREMARRAEKSPALRRAGGAARRQEQGMPIFLFGIFYRPRKKREWERRIFGGGYAGLLFKRSGKMRVGVGVGKSGGWMYGNS